VVSAFSAVNGFKKKNADKLNTKQKEICLKSEKVDGPASLQFIYRFSAAVSKQLKWSGRDADSIFESSNLIG